MQERRVVNEAGLTQFFSRIYTLMGSGLVVTALVSYLLGFPFSCLLYTSDAADDTR